MSENCNLIYELGTRRELFIDDFLTADRKNLEFVVHRPEHRFDTVGRIQGYYQTILDDGIKLRAYARTYINGQHTPEDIYSGEAWIYAESHDGLHWVKPPCKIFSGTDEVDYELNHAVVYGPEFQGFTHNFSPLFDPRPECPSDERYKALAGVLESGGLSTFASSDGIHWRRWSDKPVIVYEERFGDYAFDSQNYAFWSAAENCFVMYFRVKTTADGRGPLKTFARSTSVDFRHWSTPELLNVNRNGEHLYVSQFTPYARAPHYYLGTPTRWFEDHHSATDIGLIFSRAGMPPVRPDIGAWIRPGLNPVRWENRMNYLALGIFTLSPEELTLYPAVDEGRYVLRTDGFVSLSAGLNGGEWLSRPLRYEGGMPEFNVSTSAGGFLQIELRREDNTPLPGFCFGDLPDYYGDEIAYRPAWKAPLCLAKGEGFHLALRMKECDLYSFKFE